MILVDASAWIAFFRGHDPLASAVDAVHADNAAVLSLLTAHSDFASMQKAGVPLVLSPRS